MLFEDGECRVASKTTGEHLKSIPKGFWDSWKRWVAGGNMVDGNLCVLPDVCKACNGIGAQVEMITSRTGIIGDECSVCHGKKFVWPNPENP